MHSESVRRIPRTCTEPSITFSSTVMCTTGLRIRRKARRWRRGNLQGHAASSQIVEFWNAGFQLRMSRGRTPRRFQMNENSERCPHCSQGVEILTVKFALRGARTVWRCVNCAAVYVEPRQSKTALSRYSAWKARMIEALNSRVKGILFVAFAAVLVAGVLRHTLHVYAGFSREDIRSESLLLVSAVAIVVVLVRIFRRS